MTKVFLFLFIFTAHSVFATGITFRTKCQPLLENEGHPEIEFIVSTGAAPGGPVWRKASVKVGGSVELKELNQETNTYEKNVIIDVTPVKTPSGTLSSFFKFITLDPGQSELSELFEILYRCGLNH